MATTAKLFMSGRSQALRLPAKLRMDAEEVVIERIGNALWVQPKADESGNLGEWLRSYYASVEPLPADFLAQRTDAAPQERDWA